MLAAMTTEQINRFSNRTLIALALVALVDVVALGYLFPIGPPTGDEGTGAHIFQLAIALLLPVGVLFLATADWARPARIVRLLALPGAVTVLAFAALFYLEHYVSPIR
jgi:hypothetical protein